MRNVRQRRSWRHGGLAWRWQLCTAFAWCSMFGGMEGWQMMDLVASNSNSRIWGNFTTDYKLMLFMVLCRRWVISTNFLVELLDGDSITIASTPVNKGIVHWKCASSTGRSSNAGFCFELLTRVMIPRWTHLKKYSLSYWKWIFIAYSSFGSLA